MTRVDIQLVKSEPTAECEQCDRIHPQATRERVRLHVKTFGHTVRMVVEHVTVYQPPSGSAL